MYNLRYYLPETMTQNQEKKLSEVSKRLNSYGWTEKFIREWWQAPSRNLNGFCPLEALCADKYDLVDKSLEKTLRLYESNLNLIEQERKEKIEALDELATIDKNNEEY